MVNISDDDFDLDFQPSGGRKDKGKARKKEAAHDAIGDKRAKAGATCLDAFSLDLLLAECTFEAKRAEKTSKVLVNTKELDAITDRTFDIVKEKAKTNKTEALDKFHHIAIRDEPIKIPGVIRVLRPQNGAPTDVHFNFSCPRNQLKVLYESLKLAEGDTADLEELLLSELVPWVRRKLGGKAPSDVCRWLFRLVVGHESPMVVLAAEEALHQLLEESQREWNLAYVDVQDLWRRCGAVWLDGGEGSIGPNNVQTEDEEDEEEGDRDVVIKGDIIYLKKNLKPALNVVWACIQNGAHSFTSGELQELMVDFAAVALDRGVTCSCQTELYTAIIAVANAIPAAFFDDKKGFSSLVDALCDPSERALEGLVEPATFVLLANIMPYRCSGSFSLRHNVCHRLLVTRFLSDTSYARDDSLRGFKRALKALQVLSDNEGDILKDYSEAGYQRQYAVVALSNGMAAGALVLSKTGKPDALQSASMISAIDKVYHRLINTMQLCVQMSKTMLDVIKGKYTPYLASSGQQGKLSFAAPKEDDDGGGDREVEGDESVHDSGMDEDDWMHAGDDDGRGGRDEEGDESVHDGDNESEWEEEGDESGHDDDGGYDDDGGGDWEEEGD